MLPRFSRAQTTAAIPERLLFVVAATGGGSILDSFLPVAASDVSSSEAASTLLVHPDNLVAQPQGSTLRCVRNRGGNITELPAGYGLAQDVFLQRHHQDTAVLTVEGTSVNHRVAQKRSLTGNSAHTGRTIQEAMAVAHGESLLLPNCNMASDGYLEPGDDVTLPLFARAEPIADPSTFPLATHGSKGILGAPASADIARVRSIRDRLDDASPFGHTYQNAPLRQRVLAQRAQVEQLEALDLVTELMFRSNGGGFPLENFGLSSSSLSEQILDVFPDAGTDAFHAQAALAFLLARSGAASSVTLAPSFLPIIDGISLTNPPLAFDFSHVDHYGTQNVMWSRILLVVDGLIQLLKSAQVGNTGTTLFDRSLIYIATEFGRSKTRPANANDHSTGHHLNNGVVMISPLLKGNRVYGGVDPETCLTYGFDPATGDPRPGTRMAEADVHGVLCQAMNIDYNGRGDYSGVVR